MMTLHLRAAGTSLVLDLPADRFPVVRHWGADLGDVPGETLADSGLAQTTSLGENSAWIANDLPILPLPYVGWSARPAVLLHRTDGTSFSPHPDVVTHEVARENSPAGTVQIVRSEAHDEVHAYTLGTEIRLEPSGLVRVRTWVRDDRPDASSLAPLAVDEITPVLPLPETATEILDMAGHHIAERSLQRHELTVGTHLRESWEGRPGHDATTWLAAGARGFGFRSGTVHGVHLAWSGNTRSLILSTSHGHKLIGAGELLLPGEIILDAAASSARTYTSPWATFSWGEGLDALSHRTHAFLRSLPSHPSRPRPVLLNTWEAAYFDHNLDKLKALADAAAEVGIERYVLDDGWFGSRRDDLSGLGDWQVSPEA